MRKPLTERQQKVLAYIHEYIAAKGYAPSVREISDDLDIRSLSMTDRTLNQLARAGKISRVPRVARGIRLVETPAHRSPDATDHLSALTRQWQRLRRRRTAQAVELKQLMQDMDRLVSQAREFLDEQTAEGQAGDPGQRQL